MGRFWLLPSTSLIFLVDYYYIFSIKELFSHNTNNTVFFSLIKKNFLFPIPPFSYRPMAFHLQLTSLKRVVCTVWILFLQALHFIRIALVIDLILVTSQSSSYLTWQQHWTLLFGFQTLHSPSFSSNLWLLFSVSFADSFSFR